ncbi:expressed unknown protein [Seminavis robusta]|uniref:VWFD domain-containing protein n=1 Tax=Seminavis robusta TaxID=568900 RepID=A0A9N8DV24_9STRA|nr:expressed unknown protein [Seminavis robusta]|eukprot:Sro303_g112490.1 n/a (214) ;mRNA; f:66908-67549
MIGDPHIRTWFGKQFDYHGECDLVLIAAPGFQDGLGLHLHVRTKIQFNTYSYIEAAALQIGQDVLEVGSYGDYYLNGVESAEVNKPFASRLNGRKEEPASLSGFPIHFDVPEEKKKLFSVKLSANEVIHITVWKQIVSVKLDHSKDSQFAGATGLMGDYDADGLMLARDGGAVMENPNEFGQEWQVRDSDPQLFLTAREPQYPQQCKLPSASS